MDIYLLESPHRGDSNKYPQRMFSQRITWDCQRKNKDPLIFVQTKLTFKMNFAVITGVIIKRVHCSTILSADSRS